MTTASMGYGPTTVPRLRITKRGRSVLAFVVSVPLVIAALAYGLNGGSATATDSSAPVQYVSLQAGQSLWSLAESIAPTADPRDVIADIRSYNNLASSEVVAGQRIAIPGKYQH